MYKIETADYKKLLDNNLTQACKKSDQRKINDINKDSKKIAVVVELRIEKIQENESYWRKRPQRRLFRKNIVSFNKPIKVGHC